MGSNVTPRTTAIAFLLAALFCVLAACGDRDGDHEPPPIARSPDSSGPLLAAADGRRVVAEVDGVPIYDDCVRIQAEAHGLDARAALNECIDFELLALEAQRRGYREHPAVQQSQKDQAVRRLLDVDIVTPMPSVESVDRADLEAAYQRYRKYIYLPERRSVFHVFAAFDTADPPPGSADDTGALALAQVISSALAEERGVTQDRLLETARRLAEGRAIGPINPHTNEFQREVFWVYINKPDLPHDFSQAVFEIAEPGRVSRPMRSRYGWHVVLLLERELPRMTNADEAAEWLFQRLRVDRFEAMIERLSKDMELQVDEQALARMQEEADALAAESDGASQPAEVDSR